MRAVAAITVAAFAASGIYAAPVRPEDYLNQPRGVLYDPANNGPSACINQNLPLEGRYHSARRCLQDLTETLDMLARDGREVDAYTARARREMIQKLDREVTELGRLVRDLESDKASYMRLLARRRSLIEIHQTLGPIRVNVNGNMVGLQNPSNIPATVQLQEEQLRTLKQRWGDELPPLPADIGQAIPPPAPANDNNGQSDDSSDSSVDSSSSDSSSSDSSTSKSSSSDTSSSDSSSLDTSSFDFSSFDSSRTDSSRTDSSRTDSSKTDYSKTDSSRTDSSRTDSSRTDSSRTDSSRTDSSRTDSSSSDSSSSGPSNPPGPNSPNSPVNINQNTQSSHSSVSSGSSSDESSSDVLSYFFRPSADSSDSSEHDSSNEPASYTNVVNPAAPPVRVLPSDINDSEDSSDIDRWASQRHEQSDDVSELDSSDFLSEISDSDELRVPELDLSDISHDDNERNPPPSRVIEEEPSSPDVAEPARPAFNIDTASFNTEEDDDDEAELSHDHLEEPLQPQQDDDEHPFPPMVSTIHGLRPLNEIRLEDIPFVESFEEEPEDGPAAQDDAEMLQGPPGLLYVPPNWRELEIEVGLNRPVQLVGDHRNRAPEIPLDVSLENIPQPNDGAPRAEDDEENEDDSHMATSVINYRPRVRPAEEEEVAPNSFMTTSINGYRPRVQPAAEEQIAPNSFMTTSINGFRPRVPPRNNEEQVKIATQNRVSESLYAPLEKSSDEAEGAYHDRVPSDSVASSCRTLRRPLEDSTVPNKPVPTSVEVPASHESRFEEQKDSHIDGNLDQGCVPPLSTSQRSAGMFDSSRIVNSRIPVPRGPGSTSNDDRDAFRTSARFLSGVVLDRYNPILTQKELADEKAEAEQRRIHNIIKMLREHEARIKAANEKSKSQSSSISQSPVSQQQQSSKSQSSVSTPPKVDAERQAALAESWDVIKVVEEEDYIPPVAPQTKPQRNLEDEFEVIEEDEEADPAEEDGRDQAERIRDDYSI